MRHLHREIDSFQEEEAKKAAEQGEGEGEGEVPEEEKRRLWGKSGQNTRVRRSL